MIRTLTTAAAVTLIACAPALAQGPIDLKVAAKKGASVWLLQRTTHTQAIDAQGMELGCEHTLNRVLQFTVKDVDGKGHALVETRIARAYGEFSLPMGMGDASFDSAAPATAASRRTWRATPRSPADKSPAATKRCKKDATASAPPGKRRLRRSTAARSR